MKSILSPGEGCCFFCGGNGTSDPLDKHHVFGGAYRQKSERYGLTVRLCHFRCHEYGPEAVHRSARRDRELKAFAQAEAMNYYGWSVSDFVSRFGKNYLDMEVF